MALAASREKSFPVYDFSKGCDTYHSSLSLPDGYVQNCLNVVFGSPAPVSGRQGYVTAFSSKTYQLQPVWTFTDRTNTSWLIVRASDTIFANSLSGSASVFIATVSANNLVSETNAFGNAYFVDQTQGVYYWTGSTTIYVSSSPFGSLISNFHNRLWVAGAAVPLSDQLYGSKQNDGTVWTIGPNPNDPVQITIGVQNIDNDISALHPFLDTLYIGKHSQIFALYGFDQTSFQVSYITGECGIVDPFSVQDYNHGIIFASNRGVDFFDGYTCRRVSDPVKNKVDGAIQSAFNTSSWNQQTQQDWLAGTFSTNGPSNALSATILAPSLALSTYSYVDNTDVAFSAGTVGNGLTQSGNSFFLRTYLNEPMSNISNWVTTAGGWTTSPLAGTSTQNNLKYGSSPINTDYLLFEFQYNFGGQCPASGNLFGDFALLNGSGQGYGIQIFNGSVIHFYLGKYSSWDDANLESNSESVEIVSPGCDANWHTLDMTRNPLTGSTAFYLDGVSGGAFTDSSYTNLSTVKLSILQATAVTKTQFRNFYVQSMFGNFNSAAHDSVLGTPVWGALNWTLTGAGTAVFAARTSTNNSAYSSDVAVTNGNVPAVSNQRYIAYSSTLSSTNTSYQSSPATITSVSEAATASSGTFVSQCHSLSGISSFGNFSVVQDLTTGGNIVYNVCTSPNSNCSAATCAVTPVNGQITVSTNAFVDFIASFTVTASTNAPALQSSTVQWFSGTRSASMASVIWDNRYWLSLTTTTADAANDAILVMNLQEAWSILDIHAGGFALYKNALYHSDSRASGNVYLDNSGQNDNGRAINMFIRTKDYQITDLAEDKYLTDLYPTMDNAGNFNVTLNYYLDRSTNTFALSMINQTEFGEASVVKIPFPIGASNQDFGETVSYQFSETDLNAVWNFYGFIQTYKQREPQ